MAETFNLDEKLLTDNARFAEDLNIDSLDRMECIATLEKEFGITITNEAVGQMKTVGTVIHYINKNCP